MVKVAPWQAFSEALDIDAAPVRVTVEELLAATFQVPVWLAKVTPVVVQPLWPASAVIEPAPLLMLVTLTAYGFGLLIVTFTSPDPPGYSWAVVDGEASEVVSATAVVALA